MTILTDPIRVDFDGVVYDVHSCMNEEFSDQLDSFEIIRRCDHKSIPLKYCKALEDVMPKERHSALVDQCKACARSQTPSMEQVNPIHFGTIIDYADVT